MSQQPVSIFVSYSHKDKEYKEELIKYLASLENSGKATIWVDHAIDAGAEWEAEIMNNLNSAQMILLLISSDFQFSKFCSKIEMVQAMERHERNEARVIPILLRNCNWRSDPYAKLHMLPPESKPINKWEDQSDVYTLISEEVEKQVDKLLAAPTVITPSTENEYISTLSSSESCTKIANRANRNFTGREDMLDKIRKTLTTHRTVAITGLSGMGKTQLAVQYARRHATEYTHIFWINAETTLVSDYVAIAKELNLPVKADTNHNFVIEIVKNWLSRNDNWLLVFDNALESDDILDYRPHTMTGHILITSVNSTGWNRNTEQIPLEKLSLDESIEFLLKRVVPYNQNDNEGASRLANLLDRLPLALEHAGAYISDAGMSFNEYIGLFNEHHRELLDPEDKPSDYPKTITTTWNIAFNKLLKKSPLGISLLYVLSYLAPDDIPKYILTTGKEYFSEFDGELNNLKIHKALINLRKYSLIDISVNGDALSLHRLVQVVVRNSLDDASKESLIGVALNVVANSFNFNEDNISTWDTSSRLASHALSITRFAMEANVGLERTVSLLIKIAEYLFMRAEYSESAKVLYQALEIAKMIYSPDAPVLGSILDRLGSVMFKKGEMDKSISYIEQAVEIFDSNVDYLDIEVAKALNNLGYIYSSVNEIPKAKAMYERAIKINKALESTKASNLWNVLNNMGLLFLKEKKPQLAINQFDRALKIVKEKYGPDHSYIPYGLNNIGSALVEQGHLNNALRKFTESLEICEKILGSNHPEVASRLNNIGDALSLQRKYEEAIEKLSRSLSIKESTYGMVHPEVARSLRNIGICYYNWATRTHSSEMFNISREYQERSLAIFQQYFDDTSDEVLELKDNINELNDLIGKENPSPITR